MNIYNNSENILAEILLDYDSGDISAIDVCIVRRRLEEVVSALKRHDGINKKAAKMIGNGKTERKGNYFLKVHKYMDNWGNNKQQIWVWKDPYKALNINRQ